ncbi:MAG: Hsp70 family protein [Scytonematopsis contorta HA4267-MV1]|jgi:molecular chaperone DnaK (HSP70)|nr:Hsp70 family protein [Scytonematopsis contorta HA4267-MV1]
MSIAVLLDLDNIKPKLSAIEKLCQSYGQLIERRAFSNTHAVLTAYGGGFREFGYRFELAPGLNPMPQEVDNLIERTAIEIAGNSNLDVKIIAIVSNDNDYTRVLRNLKTRGIKTLVIGNQIGNSLRETADYIEVLREVMRPTYVGIDLGTTNTVMSLANINIMQQWVANAIEVPVKNEQGALVNKQIIPSSVRFSSHTEAEVGENIKAQAYAFRDQTILAWKHDMGCSEDGKPFYYQLTAGKIAPEEAAAKVLAFCRERLLQRYGEVQGAVITHPASYESDAIEATRKAAVIAGWKEEEVVLLAEPQAALYDFLFRLQKGEVLPPFEMTEPFNILVYDLGGGTLDVTLHKVQWNPTVNRFIIGDIAVGSRTRVGGDKVDILISEYILEKHPHCQTLSEADQKKLRYELPIYAEKFKKLWGAEYAESQDKENFKYLFQGNFLDSQFPIRYYISVERMREILAPLLCENLNLGSIEKMNPETAFDESPFTDNFNTFVVPVLEVLLKAKQSSGQNPKIDAVLLNGGMTYFPPVRECLAKLFGDIPILNDGNPDLAVARGAALFASGALKPGEGVNPTNIYLEVNEKDKSKLRLLVAQGQKFPYRTILKDFRLPEKYNGCLGFKVWVGMGTQVQLNTNLQRLRQVPMEKIIQANLEPGCLLDLEVEYTFDERLLLTLISQNDNQKRFQLEVTSESRYFATTTATTTVTTNSATVTKTETTPSPSINIPPIPRQRKGKAITPGVRISWNKWESMAKSLNGRWSNSAILHQERRELESKTATAENRLDLIKEFMRWLEIGDRINSSIAEVQTHIAVKALNTIFHSLDTNDITYVGLEKKYQQWVKNKLQRHSLGKIPNPLLDDIAKAPGKLLWTGFDEDLIRAFTFHERQAIAEIFLESLAKCGHLTGNTLNLLNRVIKNSPHVGQKERATWALGRLISPAQPQDWQAKRTYVESVAKLVLEQLQVHTTDARLALSLLGCLSQCVAWHTTGLKLSENVCQQVQKLPGMRLAVTPYLAGYPQIQKTFEERLPLLPKMLEIERASSEEIAQMQEWLLESLKG